MICVFRDHQQLYLQTNAVSTFCGKLAWHAGHLNMMLPRKCDVMHMTLMIIKGILVCWWKGYDVCYSWNVDVSSTKLEIKYLCRDMENTYCRSYNTKPLLFLTVAHTFNKSHSVPSSSKYDCWGAAKCWFCFIFHASS